MEYLVIFGRRDIFGRKLTSRVGESLGNFLLPKQFGLSRSWCKVSPENIALVPFLWNESQAYSAGKLWCGILRDNERNTTGFTITQNACFNNENLVTEPLRKISEVVYVLEMLRLISWNYETIIDDRLDEEIGRCYMISQALENSSSVMEGKLQIMF